MKKYKILIVDDEPDIVELLNDILSENNIYIIKTSNNGKLALGLIKQEYFDLVITDVKMPEMDGIRLLKEIKRIDKSIYVIIITAFGDINMAVEAIKHEAYDFITKPFSGQMIKLLVKKIFENRELLKINKNYFNVLTNKFNVKNIIGYTKDNKELKKILQNVIKKKLKILLLEGNKYSGKTFFAKTLHYSVHREVNIFEVDINEYSENNLYKKLFGDIHSPGILELAQKSTLLIKNIDKLTKKLQIKLFRFLSSGEILPQHSNSPKIIVNDLTFVFTSNENLKILVNKNLFNNLLYEKISIFVVHFSSLSDTKKNFNTYLDGFLKFVSIQNNFPIKTVNKEAYRLLFNYNWKENKKDLSLVVEKIYAKSDSNVITTKDLPEEIIKNKKDFVYPTLDEVEKKFIEEILDYTSGNKSIAASLLGIHRRQLYRKLEKYTMDVDNNE